MRRGYGPLTRDGVDIVTVKELLGHSDIKTTMRYAHSERYAKRRAVDKLNRDPDGSKMGTVVPIKQKVSRGIMQ